MAPETFAAHCEPGPAAGVRAGPAGAARRRSIDGSIGAARRPWRDGRRIWPRRPGLTVRPTGADPAWVTTTADTRAEAARAMCERGRRLLLFAGGDGTARDIHDRRGIGGCRCSESRPGVKMHSGVFA